MTSASLGESWSSKTGTSGCDQQICPALSHLHDIREESFKNYRSMDIQEMEGQGRRDRGGQEAEDQEKR